MRILVGFTMSEMSTQFQGSQGMCHRFRLDLLGEMKADESVDMLARMQEWEWFVPET